MRSNRSICPQAYGVVQAVTGDGYTSCDESGVVLDAAGCGVGAEVEDLADTL